MVVSSGMEILSDATGRISGRKRGRKYSKSRGLVFGRNKGPSQIQVRPVDWPGICGKANGTLPHAVTNPRKKLLFVPFDEHRITSKSQHGDKSFVLFEFAQKPFSPIRNSGNAVNLGQRCRRNQGLRISQEGSIRS